MTVIDVAVTSTFLEGKRAVICDDESITHLQLRRILARADLSVVGSAYNGQEAVETVLRERPDIVVMDVRMPLMDGIKATLQILASYPVCVLVVSAYASDGYQEKALQAGASGYLVKPISGGLVLPALQCAWKAFQSRQPGKQRDIQPGKSRRGFAAMSLEKRRAIAGKGGKSAHAQGRAHQFTPEEAQQAGRKGGQSLSQDRAHMAELGRKGAESRYRKQRER